MTTSMVEPGEAAVQLAKALAAALDDHNGQRAVVELLDACNGGIIGDNDILRDWLAGTLGSRHFQKLLAALSRYPCLYCAAGLEQCVTCGGSGIRDETICCRPCAGLGQVRCDFCGGSGLASYNHFPANLRADVLRGRIALALVGLERLSREKFSATVNNRESLWMGRILNLNKLLSVLENGRVEASRLADVLGPVAAIAALLERIDAAARIATEALREATGSLGLCLRRQNAHLSVRGSGALRAEFYEQLLEDDASIGTSLHHPFLVSKR